MGFLDAELGAATCAVAAFGQSITYTPAGAAASTFLAIFTDGEQLDDANWRAALQASATLRVLKSDVPHWSINDTVDVDGVTWSVIKQLSSTSVDMKLELRRDLRPTFRK